MQVLQVSPLDRWLRNKVPHTARSYRGFLNAWIKWLRDKGMEATPEQLLTQAQIDSGSILDLLEEYMGEMRGTYGSLETRMSILRSFFKANRIQLPPSMWRPQASREPVMGQLDVLKVREIITRASLRNRAIFLTMFQGFMDLKTFILFNDNYAEKLVNHIEKGGVGEPFRIDVMRGRKNNPLGFYTFIHRDALEAWQTYFDRERGVPLRGESIARARHGGRLTKEGVRRCFDTLTRSLRLKPQRGRDIAFRSGVNPHEAFRDVARSHIHLAREKGFDDSVAEFWMGHTIDPLAYNKFWKIEPDYVVKHAKIAASYLNILSGGSSRISRPELIQEFEKAFNEDAEFQERVAKILLGKHWRP